MELEPNNDQNLVAKHNLPGFGHALLLIGVYALSALIIGPLLQVASKASPFVEEWMMLIGYALPFSIVLFVALKWWKVTKFDTQPTGLTVYILILPLIFAMAIIMEAVVGLIPMPESIRIMFEQMVQLNLPGYITLGIAAPILEELVFRGVILKRFLTKYNPTKAILFSALIFGIGHLNPWQFVAAFSIGIAIGWIYWKTKSIWPGIFIHFINNSFSFFLAKKYEDVNITFSDIIGNTTYYISLLILCVLVIYSIYLLLDKYFKSQTQKHIEANDV